MTTAIATQKLVSDLIEEYQKKADAIPDEINAYKAAIGRIDFAATVFGTYGDSIHSTYQTAPHESTMRKALLSSAWKAAYSLLHIAEVATADDKRRFDQMFTAPPAFSMVMIREHFGKYLLNPRFHILRGLAECFCNLDPAYKSHSKVKIGVKGLPKRVIIGYWTGSHGGSKDRLRDMLNALRAYRGQPLVSHQELEDIISFNKSRADAYGEWDAEKKYRTGDKVLKDGKVYKLDGYSSPPGEFIISMDGKAWREIVDLEPGIELRIFSSSCHVIFKPQTLLDINRALAEFYGDVLPDAEEDDENLKPRASTAVSKDLQYYPTPQKVVEKVLDAVGIEKKDRWRERSPFRVLEPSCGCGRFLDEIVKRGGTTYGIEVDSGRAHQARSKGHSVLCRNFLETIPDPTFDYVVMNPPFYSRHYVKHVKHAMKFLKPGGCLVTVLPATAHYDHDELKGQWMDLPVASFSESGTNIATGYMILRAPR